MLNELPIFAAMKCSLHFFTVLFFISISNILFAEEKLIVGVVESPPFIIKNEQSNFEGISIWLWEKIAKKENIDFEYLEIEENEAIETAFSDDIIDLSIIPTGVTSSSIEKLNFTVPFYTSHSTILIKEVSAYKKIFGFIRSILSINFLRLILFLLGILLIFGLLVWLFERKKNSDFESGWKGIGSGLWWSAVTMTTVGYGDKSPKTIGGRIIGVIWMFAAIILISGFTASIASVLTVTQISSAKDSNVRDFKNVLIGTVDHSSTKEYLTSNFFKHTKNYPSFEDGIHALEEEQIKAFAYDEPILRYKLQNDSITSCIILNNLNFNPQYYAFSVHKNDRKLEQLLSREILDITKSIEWELLLEEYNLLKQ